MSVSDVEEIKLNNGDLLSRAKRHFELEETEQALTACLSYLDSHPDDTTALRLKANIFAVEGRLMEAVETINKVLELTTSAEPCDYFYRGRWLLRNGHTRESCTDFDKVVELSLKYGDAYYLDTARLHLAYSQVILGQKSQAKDTLSLIDEDCTTSINDSIVDKNRLLKML